MTCKPRESSAFVIGLRRRVAADASFKKPVSLNISLHLDITRISYSHEIPS